MQANDLLGRFNVLTIELNQFEQPETKESCQEAIVLHANSKQTVFSISIDALLNEGRQLLKILMGTNNNESIMINNDNVTTTTAAATATTASALQLPGTRDSGYSGSSSSELTEKFSLDYFNEAVKIKELMEQLRMYKQKVQNLWQQKKLKLEQCLQLRVFELDCCQVQIFNFAIHEILRFKIF